MAETRAPYQQMSPESGENPPVTEQQQQPEQQKPRHKYKRLLYIFGITEVVFGSISILLAIVTLIIAANYKTYTTSYFSNYLDKTVSHTYNYRHPLTHTSQGIWCGALLIAMGIMGIKARSNPSVAMFNANMTLAIVTACFMVPLMTMSGLAVGHSGYGENQIKSLVALHITIAILGVPAGIVCVIHSAYCCAGVCCRRKAYQGPVAYVAQPFGTNQPQQMVRLANGQYMLVPFQPMAAHGHPQSPAGPTVYPQTHDGVVVPQVTMQPQATFVQPTVVNPVGAQPVQPKSAMTSQPGYSA